METLNTKELKKLSRKEILERMLDQANENEKLKAEVADLTAKLNDRTIAINKAGTLAEASVLVNNILMEADRVAKDYLTNMERMTSEADCVSKEKIAEAQAKSEEILTEARQEADKIVSHATVERDRIKMEAESYWTELSSKMEAFYQAHKGLREMLDAYLETHKR